METNMKLSQRGFVVGEFLDYFNNKCSIQESSIMHSEGLIWLGIDKNFQGEKVNERMHLTQEQVKKLLPLLERFAETGILWTDVD